MSISIPLNNDNTNMPTGQSWLTITSSLEPRKERFECACGMEMLVAEDLEDDDEVQLAFWQYGAGAPGWRYRLRAIWRILRRGYPYGDYFILSPANQRALGVWLLGKPHKQDFASGDK